MPTVVKPTRRRGAPAQAEARSAARTRAPRPKARPAPPAPDHPLVGWAALAGKPSEGAARKKAARSGFVDAVPTLRFAIYVLLACAALVLYMGHQYASQALVEEVQTLRREQTRLVLQHNRLRGEFDRMTAPGVILRRAEALGLRSARHYAPTIVVE